MHAAMKEVRDIAENQQTVIVQKTNTCSYGEVRYKLASALNGVSDYRLSDDFKYAIRELPSHYSVNEYMQFLDDWGTVSSYTLYIYHKLFVTMQCMILSIPGFAAHNRVSSCWNSLHQQDQRILLTSL